MKRERRKRSNGCEAQIRKSEKVLRNIMGGLSSDEYSESSLQDFNLEYSFEMSDLAADIGKNNLSGIGEEKLGGIESLNLTDADIGNLTILCGLTITNQSLKIVQVAWTLHNKIANA